jgi:hypothetical protein
MAFRRSFHVRFITLSLFTLLGFTSVFGASLQFVVSGSGTPPSGSLTNEITVGNWVSITMQTTFPQGYIFYTVDGSQPSFASTPYSGGPLQFQTNTTLRAIAYNSALTENVRAQLIINIVPVVYLRVTSTPESLVTVTPASDFGYFSNSIVTLTAPDRDGLTFQEWQGDASGTNREIQVLLNKDRSIHARYITRPALTIPAGGGTVEVVPEAGQVGEVLQVAAIPDATHFFATWGGSLSGNQNPVPLYLYGPTPPVSALFAPLDSNQVSFTAIHRGPGRFVRSRTGNVFTRGEQITLELDLAPRGQNDPKAIRFQGWTGTHTGFENPLTITLDENTLIRASTSIPQVDTSELIVGSGTAPVVAPDGTLYVVFNGQKGQFYFEGAVLAAYTSALQQLWATNVEVVDATAPSIADSGNIYVGSANGDVVAVDPAGKILWRFTSGKPAAAGSPRPVVISEDETIYSSSVSDVYVIKNGQLIRTIPAYATNVPATPVIGPDGMLYIPTAAAGFSSQTPAGQTNWTAPYPQPSALDADGHLYSVLDNAIVALDSAGSNLWTTAIPNIPSGGSKGLVIRENGNVFIVTSAGVVALNKSGAILWTNACSGEITAKADGGLLCVSEKRPIGATFSTIKNVSADGKDSWFEQWWENTWYLLPTFSTVSPAGDIYQMIEIGGWPPSSRLYHTKGDAGIARSAWPSVWGLRNTGRAARPAASGARLQFQRQGAAALSLRSTGLSARGRLESSADLQNWQFVQEIDPEQSVQVPIQQRQFYRIRVD